MMSHGEAYTKLEYVCSSIQTHKWVNLVALLSVPVWNCLYL